MSKLFSTGLSIPADKRDLFTLKFESALLRYNVRAYFGPINSKKYCPIKLNHLSLKTPGPQSTAWDLKMAKKFVREGLQIDGTLMKSDLNQIKSLEVITLDDSGTSQESSFQKVDLTHTAITLPEIIVLDGPSAVQNFDLTEHPDISIVNLVDDSFAPISTDNNNDGDIQIVTVKVNSPVKRKAESDVIILSSNVIQVNKKRKIYKNEDMQIEKFSLNDLKNISMSSSGYSTPVEFGSKHSVEKIIRRGGRNRNQPILKKAQTNEEVQSETSRLRDLSNISSPLSDCNMSVVVAHKSSVNNKGQHRAKTPFLRLKPAPKNMNNLKITVENRQKRGFKHTNEEAGKIEEVQSLRGMSNILKSSQVSMPVEFGIENASKNKKEQSASGKHQSNLNKSLQNLNNLKITLSPKNSSNQGAGQITPNNLNNIVGKTFKINSPVRRKAESDVIVLSSNVKQVKKKHKIEQNEEVQITKLSSNGLGEFVSGNSVKKRMHRKICNSNLKNALQNSNLKHTVSLKNSSNKSPRSVQTSLNNLKNVGGGKEVFRRDNCGEHVKISKSIKDKLPGTSKPSNYYELVNEAVNKLRKSPRMNKRFLVSTQKRGSGLEKHSIRTRQSTQQSISSAKPFRTLPVAAHASFSLPRQLNNNKNIFNPKPVEVDPEGLRPIIIDGCNISFLHGRHGFSAEGVKICVEYFHQRGHGEIKVFFPQHIEAKIGPALISDMNKKCSIIFTPSREVNGVRKTPYDDRYIVQYAVEVGGVIVSRDMYRDLKMENPRWKNAIDQRLLMPTFAGDYLMFPLDPLGKSGPSLDQLLRF